MKPSISHATFVIKRTYPAAVARVFEAWAQPELKRRWFAEGDGWACEQYELDFKEGGREYGRWRMNDSLFENETRYMDIVPGHRIVFAYSMLMGGRRFSASLVSVEFVETPEGTEQIFTDCGAYFEGADNQQRRQEGWAGMLDALGKQFGG